MLPERDRDHSSDRASAVQAPPTGFERASARVRPDMPQPVARSSGAGCLGIFRANLAPHLAVSLGALLGAPARYLVSGWAVQRWGGAFPFGTLLINVTGSLLLGFYLTLVTERFSGRPSTRLFVTTGFLGAYTTFSTFSLETVHLVARGDFIGACTYTLGSVTLTLAAVVAGMLAARAL
jgi:CrcB protein